MLSSIIFAVGAITAFTLFYKIWNFVNLYFIHESTLPRYLHGENSYALITGSSDGIGLATTKALAKRGFNVIIHGRNPEKLAHISKAMSKEFPNIKTVTVAADATDPLPAVSKVVKAIEVVEKLGGKLTILVNNIGGMGIADAQTAWLNAVFPAMLTRALLPNLMSNKPSLIINVGSYAGVFGFANLSTYCGSKAFNHLFSKSLTAEFRLSKMPIEVLGILVGQVKTSGNPDDKLSFSTLTPDEMASSILAKVGCGKALVVGSWRQCILGQLPTWLPEQMADAMFIRVAAKRNEREAKKWRRIGPWRPIPGCSRSKSEIVWDDLESQSTEPDGAG